LAITRQPELFSQRKYDLIIVGGGIYGVMLTLEAVFRGLRPLLLEKDDFGGATSFNSLRIVHGGLRYLQTLDLPRHFESVQERRWFLANFPDLVNPLPCLMPLYGKGVRRKSIFRAALLMNDLLSSRRNVGVAPENHLPPGKILNSTETVSAFPDVDARNLQGAALWHDAAVPDSQRVIMELLRWAVSHGADVANYMEVTVLSVQANNICGVVASDDVSGSEMPFRAPIVINSAGPWSVNVAEKSGHNVESWFSPSVAWNLLTDRPALSRYALAVTPPHGAAPTYFLHPWKGRLLIGTGHAAGGGSIDDPCPSGEQIQAMIDDVNLSIPDLNLTAGNIDRVFAGFLPAAGRLSAQLSKRPVIHDHAKSGGPRGLVSICGVKFTTARRVAADTLNSVFGDDRANGVMEYRRPQPARGWQSSCVNLSDEKAAEQYLAQLRQLIAEESALNLRDVIFRRTDLWENPAAIALLAPKICKNFAWSDVRKDKELKGLAHEFKIDFPVDGASENPKSENAH